MNCQDRQDQILLYAADALEPAERDELRAHLSSGCPTCAAALAEAREMLGAMPTTLPPIAPPGKLRDRLMQRALAKRIAPKIQPFGPRAVFALVSTIAAAIAVIVAMKYRHSADDYRAKLAASEMRFNALVADVQDKDASFQRLQTILAGAQETNEILKSKNLQLVSMGGDVEQPQASGRVLFDRDNRKWHVSVFDLKPLPADKAYQLWFIAPGKDPVPAPLIAIDKTGHGSLVVDVPADLSNVSVAAVTIEKAGGDVSPHSKPQLVGKVQ